MPEAELSCHSRLKELGSSRRQIQIQITHRRERERESDGAGGAVAGEVPAGRGDHDGRRRAPARLHDLPQQALPVLLRLLLLLHRLRRPILLLLQADVGTRGSSNNPGALTCVLLQYVANSVLAPAFNPLCICDPSLNSSSGSTN